MAVFATLSNWDDAWEGAGYYTFRDWAKTAGSWASPEQPNPVWVDDEDDFADYVSGTTDRETAVEYLGACTTNTVVIWDGCDERHEVECESWREANECARRIAKQIAETGRCELCGELCDGHHIEDMPETGMNALMFEDGRHWVCVEVVEFDRMLKERERETQYWPFDGVEAE